MKPHRVIPAIALILSMITLLGPSSAAAQGRLPDGSVVRFVVPAGSAVSPASSFLVFTGRPDGTADAADCGTGPLQSAVAIAIAGHTPFSVNVIVLEIDGVTNPPAVPPGTRVGSLVENGTCDSGGRDKYTGIVE